MSSQPTWLVNTGKLFNLWVERSFGDLEHAPSKFIILDLETTGLDRNKDSIFQIGVCCIGDGNVVINSVIIDTPMEQFSPEAIKITGITPELIKLAGQPRPAALKDFYEFYTARLEEGYVPVGHNLLNFDRGFLISEYARLGTDFDVPACALDTGILVKAAQMGEYPNEYESFKEFLLRIAAIRAKGIYWKLSGFCDEIFNLKQLADQADMRAVFDTAHDAGSDSLKVWLLLHRFREYASQLEDQTIRTLDGEDPDDFALILANL